MALNFKQQQAKDFSGMLNTSEFAVACLNTRTTLVFGVIFNHAYIGVNDEGLPIVNDTPVINMQDTIDIKINDMLTIESSSYIVFEVRNDGIGGQDVYLKNA